MRDIIEKIAKTPSSPFVYLPSKTLIQELLIDSQINNLTVVDDEFALYARVYRGSPRYKFIVVSHLDHPGIVLKNKFQGIPFGSVGYERISSYLHRKKKIQIRIFDPEGKYIGLGFITGLSLRRNSPFVKIDTPYHVPKNSHGLWDIPDYSIENDIIKMQNADNGAVTAVAIQLLRDINTIEDIDLQVIFTYVEEVHQISSTAIAYQGKTPFYPLDESVYVINLEAMESEIDSSDFPIIKKLKLHKPNYEDGFLLKINDGGVIYGNTKINHLESWVQEIASTNGLNFQYTISKGSTDAKSFSFFTNIPNIITLAAPCKWKHNIGQNGEFVQEEVYEIDLNNILMVIKNILISSPPKNNIVSLTKRLNEIKYGDTIETTRKIKKQRIRIMLAAQPRLKSGGYYSKTFLEFIRINLRRATSKFSIID